MKELSIEQKAKAYDEALERMKSWARGEHPECFTEAQKAAKFVFPELVEFEDEKIRKALIDGFTVMKESKNCGKTFSNHNIPVVDILAWLEKQAQKTNPCDGCINRKGCINCENGELRETEQKHTDNVEPKFKIGDTMRTLQEAKDGWTDGMPVVVSIDEEYYHCNNELIAIKDQDDYEFPPMNRKHDICDSCYEQKPTDKKGMNLAEEEMTPFQKKVFDIIDTAIEEEQGLKQVCDELLRLAHDESIQKPAWSEEDEKMCQEAIDWFEKKCFPYALESENPARESIKWLKSLKDRVQLKQEWNEDYISKSLEKCRDSYGHLDKLRIIDWLKSIRPQSHWKPSEKQIKVCKEVYADILFTKGFDLGTINGELNRLEEELKKLKE